MARYTTFRFTLDPTVEQRAVLVRHVGASRFAYNECLRMVEAAQSARRKDATVVVPRTGYDLIKRFAVWKASEDAGRVFHVAPSGEATKQVTGLAWRDEVYQQVFEEAAVDLGRALKAWWDSQKSDATTTVGFPRRRRRRGQADAFRVRNQFPKSGRPAIRLGDLRPRTVRLPRIGVVGVREDTRRLRRMVEKGRARIVQATVTLKRTRWTVALTVEAADLHPERRVRPDVARQPWIGIDVGLSAYAVAATADATEVARVDAWPRALEKAQPRLRRRHRAVTRKQKGSARRRRAVAQLSKEYRKVRAVRDQFLHDVSNELVQTHDKLVIEKLGYAGMRRTHPHLNRAVHDASWSRFATLLEYKLDWRGGRLLVADQYFPSSKTCSGCKAVRDVGGVAVRTYVCRACGLVIDRDLNAAANLAGWAELHESAEAWLRDPHAEGPVTNARGRERAGRSLGSGETVPEEAGTRRWPRGG
ncbi:RNA-guided endonuclease InsQ/TnpB family protein [Xylanimonas sp. McL0601]|uniref:RNA-guided endonuclease InsQ/TnpB family protein n=1 Tax=Xylanimonas sp. McL0601 TaxID=3414739 RepID=UPI003CE768C7